jgi:hypothetical protein
MALQFSTGLRNAILDVCESHTGATAVLKIFDGTIPANCGTADAGTVLSTVTLPADWMAAASGGTKALAGTWQDTSADATGTADYFRIYPSSPTTTNSTIQGTVGVGSGDLQLDSTNFTAGQQFTITAFTLTAPGA